MNRFFSLSYFLTIIETARTSDRWLLRILLLVTFAAFIWFILAVNNSVSVTGVSAGGTITEGIVGTPRFVNPVLALTRADQDMTALVYSGLMKLDADGRLVPDLAESISVSPDGTTYTVTLRSDATFHDGTPVTVDDILLTIALAQNDELKSPLRADWSGVIAEAIDGETILITITEPYTPFIENFTLGILPEHIWRDIPIEQIPFSEFNTTPIGSGPFSIANAVFSRSGTVESYELSAANGYNQPLVGHIEVLFFSNETALLEAIEQDIIDTTAYLSAQAVQDLDAAQWNVMESALPRTFGLFFNQNRSTVLRDSAVREALEIVIDRDELLINSLAGGGIPSSQAIIQSETTLESQEVSRQLAATSTSVRIESARSLLEDADWTQSESGTWEKETEDGTIQLEVVIRTANTDELDAVASYVTNAWTELGVSVQTEQYEQTDLVQSVIRPRDFSVLLFGLDVGRSQDLYPFWHSSQQDDPGLNIAQYANISVDDLLSEARTSQDPAARTKALVEASNIISQERPAIFLFQPTSLYSTKTDVSVVPVMSIASPSDRFSTVTQWHTDSSSLWPLFRDRQISQ